MTKQDLVKRYKDSRAEIQEYMGVIADALVETYSTIPDTYMVSLDMLAFNLDILYKSVDEMKEKGSLTDVDKYRGEKKSSSLQAFFNAQAYVHKILNSFILTPMSKSKIREKTDDIDIKEYLEEIKR